MRCEGLVEQGELLPHWPLQLFQEGLVWDEPAGEFETPPGRSLGVFIRCAQPALELAGEKVE